MTKIERPPGPTDRAFGFALLREIEHDYLGFWRDAQARHGDTVYIRHGWVDYYAFMHPEQMREVLVDKARSFVRYEQHIRIMRQLHGDSVLITEGETWQRQRRTLLPALSPKRFEAYALQAGGAARDAFMRLPADGDTPFDAEHAMNMLAMDIILRTMFGSRVQEDTAAIEQAIRSLSAIGYAEMYLPFAVPRWLPTPRQREKRRAQRLLDGVILGQIRARRARMQAGAETGEDLLGSLLAAANEGDGRVLSDREIRDQLMTIFLAGHETTATALAWAGWELAANPDVAAQAARETDQVLGAREPGFDDLARLPFISALVKETLRLHPPVAAVLVRRAIEDVRIGRWLVPRGSLVAAPFFAAHADARWFEAPERFDPERFMQAHELPRGAYLPFGTGPRVCLGNSFAMMEMTLALAMLVQRFTVRPAPGQAAPQGRMQVTVRPAGGLRLVLAPRTPAAAAPPPDAAPSAVRGCPFHA